jgi:DnaJ-class molecular chaperone
MYSESTIVICDSCKGSGKKQLSERYDHHHKYDWVWETVCPSCGGHGRLWKVVGTSYRQLSEEDLKLIPKPEEAD